MDLPNIKNDRFLFCDEIDENCEYEFLELNMEYETPKKKKIPVIILWGNLLGKKKEIVFNGECVLPLFGIANYKSFRETYNNSETLRDKSFKCSALNDKILLTEVEKV